MQDMVKSSLIRSMMSSLQDIGSQRFPGNEIILAFQSFVKENRENIFLSVLEVKDQFKK